MGIRKLRIACSVVWGLAAVLLIVLWVRSYWIVNEIHIPGCESFFGLLGQGRAGIYWSHNQGIDQVWSSSVLVPFWLMVTVTALFAGVPWTVRTSRFSVRTLLIATTLIAVGLGLVIVLTR
jgi:hypothetical protein